MRLPVKYSKSRTVAARAHSTQAIMIFALDEEPSLTVAGEGEEGVVVLPVGKLFRG